MLDPITKTLTEFQDIEDLIEKTDVMFAHLDVDGGGTLDFSEFKSGIKNLPGMSKVHMTEDDFEIVSEYGLHLGVQGKFNLLLIAFINCNSYHALINCLYSLQFLSCTHQLPTWGYKVTSTPFNSAR